MTEHDEILQRLQWLDQERRKDRALLMTLQQRLVEVEGRNEQLETQLQELADEVVRVAGMLQRFDTLEEALAQARQAARQDLEAWIAEFGQRLDQVKDELRSGLAELQARFHTVEGHLARIGPLEEQMDERVRQEDALRRQITQTRVQVDDLERRLHERLEALRLLQEDRERTTKRLIDLQGEVSALRKRLEEHATAHTLFQESLRKLEKHLQALQAAEDERRREQREFLESLSRRQAEYERTWKEWETRFQALDEVRERAEKQVQTMFNLARDVRQAQQTFEEAYERLERRIHEVTEMQRLAEERFRQEWMTFKADDQKRWTNYLLAQEEQQRETQRLLEALRKDLDALDSRTDHLGDQLELTDDLIAQRLRGLLTLVRDWMEEYERRTAAFRPAAAPEETP